MEKSDSASKQSSDGSRGNTKSAQPVWLATFRRLRGWLLVLLLVPLFVFHRLALLVDRILWPSLLKTPIDQPLFVTGLPRSGTTLMHRLVALDRTAFTTFQLWELLFAPALCEKYFLRGCYQLDQRLGGLITRFAVWLERKCTGSLDSVHATTMSSPEEDYLGLLPYDGCFLRVLMFPHANRTWRLGHFADRMSDRQKQKMVRRYRGLVARHLRFYNHQGNLHYLSKNPGFASWIHTLSETFPGSRFIALRRHPHQSVPSQLSSIASGLQFFGHSASDPRIATRFVELLAHYWKVIEDNGNQLSNSQLQIVDYSDFVASPYETVTNCLLRLGYSPSEKEKSQLERECQKAQQYKSRHRYNIGDFGLDAAAIDRVFEDINQGLKSAGHLLEATDAKATDGNRISA